jgi:hypothetical protein
MRPKIYRPQSAMVGRAVSARRDGLFADVARRDRDIAPYQSITFGPTHRDRRCAGSQTRFSSSETAKCSQDGIIVGRGPPAAIGGCGGPVAGRAAMRQEPSFHPMFARSE